MNSYNDIWDEVINILSDQLTPTAIKTWFNDCTPVDLSNNCLVLHTTTDFKRTIILSRFGETIRRVLSDMFSCDFDILIIAGDEVYENVKEDKSILPEMNEYTFDRFIVGPSNRFAHAAASGVAENPGRLYNPLFIYGNSGLGKTHLLLSIGHAIHERDPKSTIAYIKGDEFINQLIKSIKEGTAEEFRTKYRNVDLFLVDDIQFIAGRESTQEEFFHTFNALHNAGKQIIISSDKPPRDISRLEERLRSRFEWGLIADIQKPDFDTRVAILRKKADLDSITVSDAVLEMIANRVDSNIRELEGSLIRVSAYAKLNNCPIDENVVASALKDITVVRDPKRINAEMIINCVSDYYKLDPAQIRGDSRKKEIARARHVAVYLTREMTEMSLPRIGDEFGRDHSTILNSCDKVGKMLEQESEMKETIANLKKIIAER